ncbi:MAG: type I glyceraldehyde-3-phosphate dehydrogenase [Bacteroidetes bacterium GWE2_29_8]|nr:MAG: type I glyceraldehyde-3-phosphate dehydrogenase [Bacteroidetes bacterium GWE2_29_8]OFY17387.1 MAG: type I glyceraldehyde-3-phosphate dehydrogenase [Bacteroidetes bacterium GWF2_29_10]
MKTIKVAINGFGRIGRVTFNAMINNPQFEIVALNDLTDSKTLAHLLKYDSVHGVNKNEILSDNEGMIVNGRKIKIYAEKDPQNLPWKALDVDVVIESTGRFLDSESASLHIKAGAKKVIISAPAKGDDIKQVVLGVNDEILTKSDVIISNASCTTNCAAPIVKIIDDNWGVEKGFLTTTHAYTGDQRLVDAPHKDLRRARAAANSIIPTSTGAAKAITKILPHLKGNLGGTSFRVPVINGSITDFSFSVKKATTAEEINAVFKKASETSLKGILQFCEDPIVSVDVIGNKYSSIFDAELTAVVGEDKKFVKVVSWYDNETGYSNRLVDLAKKISEL